LEKKASRLKAYFARPSVFSEGQFRAVVGLSSRGEEKFSIW
jgi:hypothetical protein